MKASYSMDFLVGSGNVTKSYLTFACSRIPLDEGPISLLPQTKERQLRPCRVITCSERYIFVNYVDCTNPDDLLSKQVKSYVQEKTPKGKLVPLDHTSMQLNYD